MTPGSIVIVDWRDALPESGEPSKRRPAIVVGRNDLFHQEFGYLLVVPLTSDAAMCISEASLEIAPTKENHCKKRCYALSWNVQTIPKRRARATQARVANAQVEEIRDQIARLVER